MSFTHDILKCMLLSCGDATVICDLKHTHVRVYARSHKYLEEEKSEEISRVKKTEYRGTR